MTTPTQFVRLLNSCFSQPPVAQLSGMLELLAEIVWN